MTGNPALRGQKQVVAVQCPLPHGFDDMALTARAADARIFMAPSSIFTLDRVGYQPAIRVNVAYADDARFLAFMRAEIGA